jgi:hypothetical protein
MCESLTEQIQASTEKLRAAGEDLDDEPEGDLGASSDLKKSQSKATADHTALYVGLGVSVTLAALTFGFLRSRQ